MKKIASIFFISLSLLLCGEASFASEDGSGNEAFVRGIEYSKKGELENARGEFERALALNPDLAAARAELAKCLERLNDSSGALEQYKIITSKMPYATDAYVRMADIYMRSKDVESAIKILKEAIALNPSAAGLHEKLGIIYYDDGQTDKAKEEFKNELAVTKQSKEARRYLRLIEKREKDVRHSRIHRK